MWLSKNLKLIFQDVEKLTILYKEVFNLVKNILRNFLYLDTQLLEYYLSSIKGALYEDETIVEKEEQIGGGSLGAKVAGIGGEGKKEKTTGREVIRRVKKTGPALFQELYSILEAEQEFKYYDVMTSENWNNIRRNSLLEVNVSPRFSMLDNITDLVEQIFPLISLVETTTGQKIIDDDAAEAIKGIKGLWQICTNKGIPCVFYFKSSPEYKLISYLNPKFFKVERDQIITTFISSG